MPRTRRRRRSNALPNWPLVCLVRALAVALLSALALVLGGLHRLILAWLAGISVAAFVFYGYDKLAAQSGRLRIPERVLLWLALLGGTVGALLAMVLFRHKTRKQPFLQRFLVIGLVQVVALLAWRFGP